MQSYDDIEGFEYWNIEAWKRFIQQNIVPLHQAASQLLNLREYTAEVLGSEGGMSLSEVEEKSRYLLPFLLGGITEDGEYKENSLAKLARMIFGFYVNPKEWVTLEKETGIRASDYVKTYAEKTLFSEFLSKIKEITSTIIKLAGIKIAQLGGEGDFREIQDPDKILNIIKTIYMKSLEVSANHNYYTFFILSTRKLPWKHLKKAYPRIESNFDVIKGFLGVERYFKPELKEEDKKRDYTIWTYLEKGLGMTIYELNKLIWDSFGKEEVRNLFDILFLDVKDLKQDYIEKADQKLQEMGWKFPEYVEKSTSPDHQHKYKISGAFLSEHILNVRTRGSHPWDEPARYETVRPRWLSRSKKCDISLLKLLDDLLPGLFLSVEPEREFSTYGTFLTRGLQIEISEGFLEIRGR